MYNYICVWDENVIVSHFKTNDLIEMELYAAVGNTLQSMPTARNDRKNFKYFEHAKHNKPQDI